VWCKDYLRAEIAPQEKAKDKHPQLGRPDSVPHGERYLFSPLGGVSRKQTNVLWKTTSQWAAMLSGQAANVRRRKAGAVTWSYQLWQLKRVKQLAGK